MLSVYKQVLETSKDAVISSHKMLEQVITWTTILFGILTAAGVGALWLAWKSVGEVQTSANELRTELESTRTSNEQLKNSATEQKKLLEEQAKEAENLRTDLAQVRAELEITKKQAVLALSDVQWIVPRLETLANVDTYAMRLFSTDSKIRQAAKRTLLELSKDDDPVVRRECVRVFGAMPDYPECFADLQDPAIIYRLQELAKDPERGVQLEARHTLQQLGVVAEGESKA
jgi:hypothetical protein